MYKHRRMAYKTLKMNSNYLCQDIVWYMSYLSCLIKWYHHYNVHIYRDLNLKNGLQKVVLFFRSPQRWLHTQIFQASHEVQIGVTVMQPTGQWILIQ